MEHLQAYVNTVNKYGFFDISIKIRLLAGENKIQCFTDGLSQVFDTEAELIAYLDGLYTASVKMQAFA